MITLKQTNKFSVQRFALILRHTLRSKACTHSAAISAALFLVVLIISINSCGYFHGMKYYCTLDALRGSIAGVTACALFLSASHAFAGLGKKGKFISEAMLPATASEKFLSRIIVNICTCVVVMLVMYLAAFEILAALSKSANEMAFIDKAADDSLWERFSSKSYNSFCGIFTFNWGDTATLMAGLSIFVLGGTVWKEKALIKTTIISLFLLSVADYLNFGGVALGIIDILFSIACWRLAWRMYSRMQCSTINFSTLWHLAKNKILSRL